MIAEAVDAALGESAVARALRALAADGALELGGPASEGWAGAVVSAVAAAIERGGRGLDALSVIAEADRARAPVPLALRLAALRRLLAPPAAGGPAAADSPAAVLEQLAAIGARVPPYVGGVGCPSARLPSRACPVAPPRPSHAHARAHAEDLFARWLALSPRFTLEPSKEELEGFAPSAPRRACAPPAAIVRRFLSPWRARWQVAGPVDRAAEPRVRGGARLGVGTGAGAAGWRGGAR